MIRLTRRCRACLPLVHYTYGRTSALKVRHAGEISPQIERDVASYRAGRQSLGHNGSRTTSEGANGVSIARVPKRPPCSTGLHPLLEAKSVPSAGWKAAREQIKGVHSAGERTLSWLKALGQVIRSDAGKSSVGEFRNVATSQTAWPLSQGSQAIPANMRSHARQHCIWARKVLSPTLMSRNTRGHRHGGPSSDH